MSIHLTRHSIVKKTIHVGASTLASRLLGLVREILMARYLGVGPTAEAFITAFRIPSSLRKIFAEGALSAAFIPTLVRVLKHDGKKEASKFMMLTFFVIEGFLLLLCLLIWWKAEAIIHFSAPGWSRALLHDQIELAVQLLSILIFFIFFISTCALFAGALQAVHHYTVPALSQVVMNCLFITELVLCLYYNLSVYYLAFFIIIDGAILVIMHGAAYMHSQFKFLWPDRAAWKHLRVLLSKFLPCLITMGALELNLYIDMMLASYLAPGSISLIYYASNFMRIPLGVFAVGFSTILLPHFSRIGTYAPRRLSFYLLESAKLIFWVTVPAALLMSVFSYKAFYTVLLSENFTLIHVQEASKLLSAFALGLFFFSLNKVVLNMYYALHETFIPTIISLVATALNTLLNLILMQYWGALGIVLATSISAAIQTLLFIIVLHKKFNFKIYTQRFFNFAYRYILQLLLSSIIFYLLYYGGYSICKQLPAPWDNFFLMRIGFWLWVAPLCGVMGIFILLTRKRFGIKLHFLD